MNKGQLAEERSFTRSRRLSGPAFILAMVFVVGCGPSEQEVAEVEQRKKAAISQCESENDEYKTLIGATLAFSPGILVLENDPPTAMLPMTFINISDSTVDSVEGAVFLSRPTQEDPKLSVPFSMGRIDPRERRSSDLHTVKGERDLVVDLVGKTDRDRQVWRAVTKVSISGKVHEAKDCDPTPALLRLLLNATN